MRDFTLKKYKSLLLSIRDNGYHFQTMEEYLLNPLAKVVVLRHDSDIWPWNDLKMAKLENLLGVTSTYYFRVPETFNKDIISKIKDLGHEIGYHYEDLVRFNGNYEKAIANFAINLSKLRDIYPVKTVVMHGRPLSKWDSRLLWEKYDLTDFGLLGEPYLSIDYNKTLYLTDNGNRWDGEEYNIRDKVTSKFNFNIKTTHDLIETFSKGIFPKQIIINAHAARWNNNYLIWTYRFFLQKIKNVLKKYLKVIRSNNL